MPRKGVSKVKKQVMTSEQNVPNGMSSIDNEIESNSKCLPKQKKNYVIHNKESENNHNEKDLAVNETEHVAGKNNLEEKSISNKRGRKKIVNKNQSSEINNGEFDIKVKIGSENHIKQTLNDVDNNKDIENSDQELSINKTENVEMYNIEEKTILSKHDKKKNINDKNQSGENNSEVIENVEINAEIKYEKSVKQQKKGVKTKESKDSHNEELNIETVTEKHNLRDKPALGKRGRKKVDVNKTNSVGSDMQPANKRKRNLKESDASSLPVKDSKINDVGEGNNIPIPNEQDLKSNVSDVQQLVEKLPENKKIVSNKKKGSLKQENDRNVETVKTRAAKASKPEETDSKTRQSDDHHNHQDANEDNLKEIRIVIKRNKQTEKAAEATSKLQSGELASRRTKKNANVPNDGDSENAESKKRKKDDGVKDVKKTKNSNESAKPKNSTKGEKIQDVTALDFSNNSTSSSGNSWNLKLSSWNVNGIRAWLNKDGLSYLHHEKPDILCIQETKCSDDKLPEELKSIEGYCTYWLAGNREGYSGVGLISKEKPINIEYGIGVQEHDNEGRVITAEYDTFYLVAVYVPNSGRGLVRLNYRMQWDKDFRAYLKILDTKKPVILCGDLNVAHEEIDIANPKTNKKSAGFTQEEREGFSLLLAEGFIDTFRYLYPEAKGAYTFWTYMMNARAKNIGWRLDYFVASERFTENIYDSVIQKDVLGSDHCPVALFLAV